MLKVVKNLFRGKALKKLKIQMYKVLPVVGGNNKGRKTWL